MKYIVDSDFLFSLFIAKDSNHKKAKKIFEKVSGKKIKIVILNITLQECATVLSNKIDQETAIYFLEKFNYLGIDKLNIDPKIENLAWKLFLKQTKNKTSFVDCANLVTAQGYKFDGILSFDSFYPENLKVM